MAARLTTDGVRAILKDLAGVFAQKRDELNDLDTRLGDGDHGLSMSRGFAAVAAYVDDNPTAPISETLMQGGMQFNELAGSTIGILMFSAMRAAGKVAAEMTELSLVDLASMLEAAIAAIMKRGKAQVGQKTILDSLQPALDALRSGLERGDDERDVIEAAIRAASDGAEHTRDLAPTVGRARWFAERSTNEIDPGAVSGQLIIATVGERLLAGM